MSKGDSRDAREAASVSGPAVFAEWLAAHALHPSTPTQRLAALARFTGLDPALGWGGNLRRGHTTRIAVRRGETAWTYRQLAENEAAWRIAAGPRADGDYDELVRVVADHILCADTRPDDTLYWSGDPLDPWPWGALAIGATLIVRR
jgi:hypothetical protein